MALLHETGLVHNQYNLVGAEVVDHVGAQVVTDGIGVPVGIAQQTLHRPGPDMTGLLGRLPEGCPLPGTILAFDVRQQPEQVGAGGRSWLNSAEPARDPGHGLVEHHPPVSRVYAMARGHRTIFVCPHTNR
ncbi:hypothetical protein GCM10010405_26750 [Streptomyces macrosporus]|uniref:Uncharacterized protein n=1 Tax=Streptomyces macrosporus TaxID=44032 RepID=A0ABN3JZN1_9ACTN